MSGLGIVAGLLPGGILAGMFGWRRVFFINFPIGVAVLAGSHTLVEAELHKGDVDLLGALTSVVGMMALVYAITRGGEHGWTGSVTVASFVAAARGVLAHSHTTAFLTGAGMLLVAAVVIAAGATRRTQSAAAGVVA